MPLSEGALYLENTRVQYIHALCLARHGGEHDRVCAFLGKKETAEFQSSIPWARGFLNLCQSERNGEISPEFQAMKAQAGEDLHHAFPLRDVETQFQVKYKRGPVEEARGSLSYSQLMREAYPGSVYYYTTRPYRVFRVNVHRRTVEVRHEKKYTTKAQTMPTLVFPNLSDGRVYAGKRFGELIAVESPLQIRESIIGYKERRGPNEVSCQYPLDPAGSIYFDFPRFTRNFFTTGVTFTHPAMKNSNVKNDLIAQILFEAFLMVLPFERRDIHYAADRYRVQRGPVEEGAKFVAIYDQTYGSLRLSSRILEHATIQGILNKTSTVMNLRQEEGWFDKHPETAVVLDEILTCLRQQPAIISIGASADVACVGAHIVKVILPGSKGLNIRSNNEEFFVEDVFFSPHYRGLAYRGTTADVKYRPTTTTNGDAKTVVAFEALIEIPGESEMGLYNLASGEIGVA
jgi:DEAD/DEAH box helicase domain-containing protein